MWQQQKQLNSIKTKSNNKNKAFKRTKKDQHAANPSQLCVFVFVVGLRHMEWRVAGVVRVVDGWFCFRWIIVAIMFVVIPAA